jgi:hypothetical protein
MAFRSVKLSESRPDQAEKVAVKNVITFEPYEEYSTKITHQSIEFKVIVTNNSLKSIPDLGVSNRSEYLGFYINDSLNNPITLYNGLENMNAPRVIRPGDSDEYSLRWVLSPDAGIVKFYGNEILIQWKYMDVFSEKMKINIEKETAQFVE